MTKATPIAYGRVYDPRACADALGAGRPTRDERDRQFALQRALDLALSVEVGKPEVTAIIADAGRFLAFLQGREKRK